jgi:hypothetical protein
MNIENRANKYNSSPLNNDNNKKFIKHILTKLTDIEFIELYLANFVKGGVIIHKKFKKKLNVSLFNGVCNHMSIDPTYDIIIDGLHTEISYIYNNIKYKNILPIDTNADTISNFAYFHDIIFGYILEEYPIVN